ncbi:MAG: hypothetical protein JWN86_414 [Planctomycetota bacterium]|nr:hypothetical protein [Planctomycetota bacterium]
MNIGELELFSTQDLVNELLRRSTFQGVIVHAVDGAKSPHWDGERLFAVHHNANLGTEEAGRLLDVVSQYIANHS